MCRKPAKSKPAQGVDELSDDSSGDYFRYVESVSAINAEECQRKIFTAMLLRETKVKFQLDCGATVYILPVDEYKQVIYDPALNQLKETNKTLQMFSKPNSWLVWILTVIPVWL